MQNPSLKESVFALVILAGQFSADAAAPVLTVPSITNGVASLRMEGEVGAIYTLEGSTNLTSWFDVGSGTAEDGFLILTHDGPARFPSMFYRAIQSVNPQTFLSVGVKADTNITAHTVMLSGEPGFFRLEAPNGVIFTLEIPTNATVHATPLTMTVVTNLTGLPVHRGFLAGVQFEPEDVVFQAPAFLRIDFPTNLPSSQIVSYAFENSGALFHLQPDLVSSNSVRTLVNRLGSYGCGIFTLEELAAMAARVPPPPKPRLSSMALLDECFPANVTEATAVREVLRQKSFPIEHRIAATIAEERQRIQLGTEDLNNPTFVDLFDEATSSFFETELVPRIPNAQTKARVGEELLNWMLGLIRQRQMLGLDANEEVVSPFMCALAAEMTSEIKECCQMRGGDHRLFRELVSMERQRQLMGMTDSECGSFDWEADLTNCLPAWHGTLTFTESGSSTVNEGDVNFRSTSSRLFKYQVEMTVLSALETIVPPFPQIGFPGSTNLSITLRGDGLGAHQVNEHYHDLFDPCSGGFEGGEALDRYTLRGSRSASEVSVNLEVIIAAPGPLPGLGTSMIFGIPAWVVPQTGSTISTTRAPTSDGCDIETTVLLADQFDSYGQWSFNLKDGEFQHSADRISYTAVSTRLVESLTIERSVVLDLKRRK